MYGLDGLAVPHYDHLAAFATRGLLVFCRPAHYLHADVVAAGFQAGALALLAPSMISWAIDLFTGVPVCDYIAAVAW